MNNKPEFYPVTRKPKLILQQAICFCRLQYKGGLPKATLFLGVIFTLLTALSSCQNSSGSVAEVKSVSVNNYFNLHQFFDSEIVRLKSKQTGLQKIAALNNKTETLTLQQVDWEKELSVFSTSDINKPAWQGKYMADTTKQNGLTTLTYTATDAALRTQSVTLIFNDNAAQPTSVTIRNQSDNFVYQLTENVNYQTEKGYNIQTIQKVIFMQPETFAISGSFINK